jgi:hypothetical protein
MHAESGAAPCLGVPGALGEQAHRSARSSGAHPRTDEPAERARLADVARLSVAHTEVAALKELLSLAAIAFTADRCTRLFDEEGDERQRSDAIQPPPIEQSCRCQAGHQNDRQIAACDRFDRVGS